MLRTLALLVAMALTACAPEPTAISAIPQRSNVAYMSDVVRLEHGLGTTHPAVMRAAVLGHIAFIEAHTTLRYHGEPLPVIEIWPPWLIMATAGSNSLGMYNKNVIVLPAGFNHRDDRSIGLLVHEVVHYLQDANNVLYVPCRRRAEVLAYTTGNAWVRAQPSSIGERFYASQALIKDASSC